MQNIHTANERTLENIFEEYWSVRLSTLLLFQNLPKDSFMRRGSELTLMGKLKMKERLGLWLTI